MSEDGKITRDVREAIIDENSIEPYDEVSKTGMFISKANNCEGPFHGHAKGLLDDEDIDYDGKDIHLFMVAFFLLLSVACAGNFVICVYATLHDWSKTFVTLHLVVGNILFVCPLMWLCKEFSN